jgi:hypothetical protein
MTEHMTKPLDLRKFRTILNSLIAPAPAAPVASVARPAMQLSVQRPA